MPGVEVPKKDNPSSPNQEEKTFNQTASRITSRISINVDDLGGRVCYFSLTGNLALQAFEEIQLSTFSQQEKCRRLKNELVNRLYFAVLMFDIVVLHCSDPLRSEIVLQVLEDNIQWIISGKILFIVSNHISCIKSDFEHYINQKRQEYLDGYYSKNEEASLSQNFINTEYYERVIRVLEAAPYMVRKSEDDSFSFPKLVINDLSQQFQKEQVFIDPISDLSQILSLDLSLYQLLHIRFASASGAPNQDTYIFPKQVVDKVCKQIIKHLKQGNTIARSAIDDALKDRLKDAELTEVQERILAAISLRMDVLYCRMNSGAQLILEFHPYYEQRSMYQTSFFMEYLMLLSNSSKMPVLNSDIINEILHDAELPEFRLFYLSCMADMKEFMNLAQVEYRKYEETMRRTFSALATSRLKVLKRFKSICTILNGGEK